MIKLQNIKYQGKANRSVGGTVAIFIFLCIFGVFMILPLVYAVCNAFKPIEELYIFPPRFFVKSPSLDNFRDLFVLMNASWVPFFRYVFNTVFITVVGTLGHLLISSLAAYVLEKHKFPGRDLFFGLVVTTLMFSPVVTAIPNYLIMVKLHLIDTYWALILPAFCMPLGLFLMKQFMSQVHDSMLESAKLEGAGELRILFKIVMPMVKPAWLTLIILCLQSLWNSTGGAYIYKEQLKTLSFALNQIITGGIARAGIGSAVTLMMMSVPIIVFVVSQSQIIETMGSAGIKE